MSKFAVVYWSGTGNTQAMAEAVLEGIVSTGGEGKLFAAHQFEPSMVGEFEAIAFGCPSMGAEQLEEGEFEPMFRACEPSLNGKRLALFGSYGWGDGEWMSTWEEDCRKVGGELIREGVICMETPDETVLEECRALGKSLAE